MYYESYYEYIPKKKFFFLNFYLRFLVPLKFEFGHDIYIIRKLMKNSIDLGSYMLKKSIFKKKFFVLAWLFIFLKRSPKSGEKRMVIFDGEKWDLPI